MKYLLYYQNGFIRKFPLKKKLLTVGRDPQNDLVLDYEFVSRHHLSIKTTAESITIEDLDSVNGTFFKGNKIHTASITLNDSFFLGGMEFILRQGGLEEFAASPELEPIFDKIKNDREESLNLIQTKSIANVYVETLKEIMTFALKQNDFNTFIMALPIQLTDLDIVNNFFLISWTKNQCLVHLANDKTQGLGVKLIHLIEASGEKFFQSQPFSVAIPDADYTGHAYPLELSGQPAALINVISNKRNFSKAEEQFILSLVKIIELNAQLLKANYSPKKWHQDWKKVHKKTNPSDEPIVFSCAIMKQLIEQALVVAATDLFVLIRGESGTGKELLAKLLHQYSDRNINPLVALNCAAIPENLLESELFGYEKGAFTGAWQSQKGKLELASKGTLILDEIGDMPLSLQAKLLRVLQENEFYKLGGNQPIKVDLRIISITNQDLKQAIRENRFRKDLYYRLVHHEFVVPSLRERSEDFPLLLSHFTYLFCQQQKKLIRGFTMKALAALRDYSWEGNIRQFKNEIKRIVSLTPHSELIPFDILSADIRQWQEKQENQHQPSDRKEFLENLMNKHHRSISNAAKELNITYQALHKQLKKLGIKQYPS
jgi:DNA-binding NtrC family response regulator/pSer/pThr/pTyr-binding forkhead associated (FHA) protein